MDQKNTDILAIVGGGRWGRVFISVLSGLDFPFSRVIVISKFNADLIRTYLSQMKPEVKSKFSVLTSLDEIAQTKFLKAAIVVNSAYQHFSTVARFLDQGVHVLVEKPATLFAEEARLLTSRAREKLVCLSPGLNYRFCSYLHTFAQQVDLLGSPHFFLVEWSDASEEIRYGEVKSYDSQIDVAQDIMPHVWSILSTVFRQTSWEVVRCLQAKNRHAASFAVCSKNGLEGHVVLQRISSQRCRKMMVQFSSGEVLSIDFSTEPGVISRSGQTIIGSLDWDSSPRPVARQLIHFFSQITHGISSEEDLQACVHSVTLAESASTMLNRVRGEIFL